MDKTGGPAFPVVSEYGNKLESAEGMTLRDYFATHSDISLDMVREYVFEMRAEQATYTTAEPTIEEILEARAVLRMMEADAMLKAREKK